MHGLIGGTPNSFHEFSLMGSRHSANAPPSLNTSYARLTRPIRPRTIPDPLPGSFEAEVAVATAFDRSKSHGHKELGCHHGRTKKTPIQVSTQYAAFARCCSPAQVAILLPVRHCGSIARHLPELWLLPRSADDSAARRVVSSVPVPSPLRTDTAHADRVRRDGRRFRARH